MSLHFPPRLGGRIPQSRSSSLPVVGKIVFANAALQGHHVTLPILHFGLNAESLEVLYSFFLGNILARIVYAGRQNNSLGKNQHQLHFETVAQSTKSK